MSDTMPPTTPMCACNQDTSAKPEPGPGADREAPRPRTQTRLQLHNCRTSETPIVIDSELVAANGSVASEASPRSFEVTPARELLTSYAATPASSPSAVRSSTSISCA